MYNTENATQYSIIAYTGKESEKEWIYVYVYISVTESLCCTPEINILLINATPI